MLARKERKAQLREALGVVSRVGLVADRGLWSVVAATRLLLDLLSGKASRRASDAAARIVKLYDLSLKNNPPIPEPACRRGCAFCCHAFVSATAPEIFLVARHLTEKQPNDLPAVIARLRTTQQRIHGLDKVARHQSRQPCGLLIDGACSVYAARPLACRAFASFSREKCEQAWNEGGDDIPIPSVNMTLRAGCNQALWSALTGAKLPTKAYELVHGVLTALETPDAEQRWLAGEDIFGGVAFDETVSLTETTEAKHFLEVVGAAAMGRNPPTNQWI